MEKKTIKKFVIILSVISAAAVATGIRSLVLHKSYVDTLMRSVDDFVDVADLFTYEDGAETTDNTGTSSLPETMVVREADVKPADIPEEETETGAEDVQGFKVSLYGYEIYIPEWDGATLVLEINGNTPFFSMNDTSFYSPGNIEYSEPDGLGRSGAAEAVLTSYMMPDGERDDAEELEKILPTGFLQAVYPESMVGNGYLYNRCHLIGYQLGGETIETNIIAGTEAMNTEGMLPFENKVAGYLKQNKGKGMNVLYRVTPVFSGDEKSCRGVLMEAESLNDNGSLSFNVFCYNEQPGIVIEHSDGSSRALE